MCASFTGHLLVSSSLSVVMRIFLLIARFPGIFCTGAVSGSQTCEFITMWAKALGRLIIGFAALWFSDTTKKPAIRGMPGKSITQGSAHFFCEGPGTKYIRLCRPFGLQLPKSVFAGQE